jgi:hypothetical protein
MQQSDYTMFNSVVLWPTQNQIWLNQSKLQLPNATKNQMTIYVSTIRLSSINDYIRLFNHLIIKDTVIISNDH